MPQGNGAIDELVLPLSVGNVRNKYFNGSIDFNHAVDCIDCRRETDQYLFFKRIDEDNKTEFVKSKASFRGNDVYKSRVWNRHKELLSFCELNKNINFIRYKDNGFVGNILKFTCTVDPSNFSRDEWNKVLCSRYYDLFVKRLRNNFPGVVLCRSYEVSMKKAYGYIHINVVALFTDNDFKVYLHKSKKIKNSKGEFVKSWRVCDYNLKNWFNDCWDPGFVDVRVVKDPVDLAEYSLKYQIKNFTNKESKRNQDFTNSVLSLYNKRSFSFPRGSVKRGSLDFCESVINYTVGLNGEGVVFPRLDVIGHNSLRYEFIGCYLDLYNEFDSDIWFEVVDRPPDILIDVRDYHLFEDLMIDCGQLVELYYCDYRKMECNEYKKRLVSDKKRYNDLVRRYGEI